MTKQEKSLAQKVHEAMNPEVARLQGRGAVRGAMRTTRAAVEARQVAVMMAQIKEEAKRQQAIEGMTLEEAWDDEKAIGLAKEFMDLMKQHGYPKANKLELGEASSRIDEMGLSQRRQKVDGSDSRTIRGYNFSRGLETKLGTTDPRHPGATYLCEDMRFRRFVDGKVEPMPICPGTSSLRVAPNTKVIVHEYLGEKVYIGTQLKLETETSHHGDRWVRQPVYEQPHLRDLSTLEDEIVSLAADVLR